MKIQESIAREFDVFSTAYTEDMIKCVPHYMELLRGICPSLPNSFTPQRILDLGCGNGNAVSFLIESFPDSRYTLVDASGEMLQDCQRRFAESEIELHEVYFEQYDFPVNAFDLIIASFSFHHLDENQKQWIFKKCFESLRKGGFLIMADLMISKTDPNHADLINEWKTFVINNYADEGKWGWLMDHYAAFDKPDHYQDQMTWLAQTGFMHVHIPFQKGYWTLMQAIKK